MRPIITSAVICGLAVLSGCSKQPGNSKVQTVGQQTTGQDAVITLADGSGFAGKVTQSSTSSITLVAPNGETRTYPMSQVASVQYNPGQQTASTSNPTVPPSGTAAPLATQPASASPTAASSPAPVQTAPAPVEPTPVAPAPVAAVKDRGTERSASAPVAIASVVPAGARLTVRNNEAIDSKTAAPGQTYSAVVVRNVVDTRGRVVIPDGSPATLVVRGARSQGELQGRSELALDIDSVSVRGRRYRVETTDVVQKGREGVGTNKRTAKFLGGGTALGTLLGAVAGGGRGAAIGAISGAAAGTATQAITRGKGVRVPSETLMTFRLEAPIHIRELR